MCRNDSEGIKYGCGHYVKTRDVRKIDCGRPDCTLSSRHPRHCNSPDCAIYYGPDRTETITHTTEQYCQHCDEWYKPNLRRH
ncbi:hypothetical protein Moror_6264 [Moniliophthora roreri MCA 2997]|uniref:Uncharacterized protein n=1 Tax=Moniliophthora roreri (strain MCA 2997) TaxID=1381753 RepID=V2XWF9_MONRO|nr:hypothetical protein Moror_6264 [Moniliophthora roreri MCA 2997]